MLPEPPYGDFLAAQVPSMARPAPLAGGHRRADWAESELADPVCAVVRPFDFGRAQGPERLFFFFVFDFSVEGEDGHFFDVRFKYHCHARDRLIQFWFFARGAFEGVLDAPICDRQIRW